jgi:hypothetical protein
MSGESMRRNGYRECADGKYRKDVQFDYGTTSTVKRVLVRDSAGNLLKAEKQRYVTVEERRREERRKAA